MLGVTPVRREYRSSNDAPRGGVIARLDFNTIVTITRAKGAMFKNFPGAVIYRGKSARNAVAGK